MKKGKSELVGGTPDFLLEDCVCFTCDSSGFCIEDCITCMAHSAEGAQTAEGDSRLAYVNAVTLRSVTLMKEWRSRLWMKCSSFPQHLTIDAYIQIHMLTGDKAFRRQLASSEEIGVGC